MSSARSLLADCTIPRLLVVAGMASLAACTPASSSLAGVTTQAAAAVRANSTSCPSRVVYVVASYQVTVDIYDPRRLKAGPCGSITGFQSAQGLFVDQKGNLWVADALAQNVYEFAPGSNAPVMTLNDPSGVPAAVTVDETSGTVYVTEYENNFDSTTLVEVYANGSAIPTSTLGDSAARNGGFDAVDNRGNLYVTFMTRSNTAQVDRWTNGTGSPVNLGLKLVSAGAILTTSTGALAVCDPFAYRCGIFEPGAHRMSHVFAHIGRGGSTGIIPDKRDFLHPNALALDRGEHRTYVAAGSLSRWAFPGPTNRPNHRPLIEVNVSGGAGNGIAASPASRPGAPF